MLSLNPSLSVDSAEYLSRRLDGFEKTLSVLSSRLRVSYCSEVQLLSDLDTLLFIVSQQRQHCEDLPHFALHAEEEEQLSTARVGVVRSGVPGRRGSIFLRICWKYFVMHLDFAGLLILLPPPRAKRNKISPPNKACKERKNSSNS